MEQKTSQASMFFHRQFWSCVKVNLFGLKNYQYQSIFKSKLKKLFTNVFKWRGALSDSIIKELSIDSLLNRYLMFALQSMDLNMTTILKIEYVIN